MRIRLASRQDIWTFLAAQNWPVARFEYRLLMTEMAAGRVLVAIDSEEVPVALGGLLDAGRTVPEGWLSVAPGTGPKFLRVALGMRRVLAAFDRAACFIRDDNAAGARIGRMLGFRPADATCGAMREWRR